MSKDNPQGIKPVWIVRVTLAIILLLLFHKSFEAGQVLFSSDGPLGTNHTSFHKLPSAFAGIWQDLSFLGDYRGSAPISISWGLLFLLGPVGFAKFYAPLTLLILGMAAWVFFRSLRLSHATSLIAAIATSLNGGFFSYACWGLGTLPLTVAMFFFALAALTSAERSHYWPKTILAGFAIGMGIMEGFDVGAILSLFVAAYAVFLSFNCEGSPAIKAKDSAIRVGLVAVCAAFISAQTLTGLIATQIEGIETLDQNAMTDEQRWDWATQWSLPKTESLRLLIPGLFGYRMDTENGGQYWGSVGQTPGWETHKQGLARHSGSGFYGGVLVCLVAVFAVVSSFRKQNGPFSKTERRRVWFWFGVFLISLVLSWGRHFPLYQLFYSLPGAANIRNPIKFLHTLDISLIILFAHGIEALFKQHVGAAKTSTPFGRHLVQWWRGLQGPEKKWAFGNLFAVAAGLLFMLIWISSNAELRTHLISVAFAPADADAIIGFSRRQILWFVLILVISSALVLVTMSGWFDRKRTTLCTGVFATIVAVDLGLANRPWIVHYDYQARYAEDALVKHLKEDSHLQRVTIWPYQLFENQSLITLLNNLQQLYRAEWIQHQFPYHDINALEYSQEPREAAENAAFRAALHPISPETPNQLSWVKVFRNWELTSTRRIISPAGGFADFLNKNLDPVQNRFEQKSTFRLESNGAAGYQTVADPNGSYAVMEFKGALPKVKLYSNWIVSTNDAATLQRIASPEFDPSQQVIIAQAPQSAGTSTNAVTGSIEWTSYAPKHILLDVETDRDAVLLLNDKHHPHWRVSVDGEEQPLLRCNFIMRGVEVPAGSHKIEFTFTPPRGPMWITLLGIAGAIALVALIFVRREQPPAQP